MGQVTFYRQQYTWDANGNLEYVGGHTDVNATDGTNSWHVWKYTWTSGSLAKIEGPLRGSWTDRATLGWA
jgi:hypothetical protein